MYNIINNIRPDEVYNLGAQSHVGVSFDNPEYTAEVSGVGTLRLLEAIRFLKIKKIKFYQASTSELFGETYKKIFLMKTQNFIQNLPMVLPNFILIGLLLFIESHTEFLQVMVFCLIMKVQEEEKHL